jgi:hypothetical protein
LATEIQLRKLSENDERQCRKFLVSLEGKFQKITWLKLNIIAVFRWLQLPAPYFAPPCESIFAETVNRTKMFHVKQFGTIAREIGQCLWNEGSAYLRAFEIGFKRHQLIG